ASPVLAAKLSIVMGSVGRDTEVLRQNLDIFEQRTGHEVAITTMPASTTDQFGQYRLWLAAGNQDVDVYSADVIWAPQLANHLVDLSKAAADVAKDHFPSIIESQTVNGRLVAIPWFTDAPALYYRIAPKGVLAYQEEEARGVWQTGNAAFMRNWPYAYGLGNGDDSAVKGKFGVAPLPSGGSGSAATLGGWNLAVSKYSQNQDAAIALVKFLTSAEIQKVNALETTKLPTIISLYEDSDIARVAPIIPQWKEVFLNAVPRPSAPTKRSYNEVSKEFWTAVHNTLSGNGSARSNLAKLEGRLKRLRGSDWK
ncbi:MAG: extracellular solute-binding protein, partial [Rhodospirillales bacterium]